MTDWRKRVDALWDAADRYEPDAREEFVAAMAALAAERPAGDPVALYEHGSAYDAMGREPEAEPLYRRALAAGLSGPLRRECVIQLASTLRNLDRAAEALALLDTEAAAASDQLDDAVQAFRALTLAALGREREATGVALLALSAHLPRFQRSVGAYARELGRRAPASARPAAPAPDRRRVPWCRRMIGRLEKPVLDCPDPRALADFYAELLGMQVNEDLGDWVVIGTGPGARDLAFQRSAPWTPPDWPDPRYPQQMHLDIRVQDADAAERAVLALGARRLPGEWEGRFRVFADPAGHPFCLVFGRHAAARTGPGEST